MDHAYPCTLSSGQSDVTFVSKCINIILFLRNKNEKLDAGIIEANISKRDDHSDKMESVTSKSTKMFAYGDCLDPTK